jgi:hypothetical protein
LFHSEYRYDDVQRFSTTILEQKQKARYIVQSFAQLTDFLIKKKKRRLTDFKNHSSLTSFESHFEEAKYKNLLHKMGFKKKYAEELYAKHLNDLRVFRRVFTWFERAKSQRGLYKVADGITRDAIFCMRDILRELPQMYLTRGELLSNEEFIEIIRSSYARKSDLNLTPMMRKQIKKFQISYLNLIDLAAHQQKRDRQQVLLDVTMRSSIINKYDRVTGDSISHVVTKVSRCRPRLQYDELYKLLREFAHYQTFDPEAVQKLKNPEASEEITSRQRNLLRGITDIVRDCREGL